MVKFLIKVDFLNSRIEFSPNIIASKEPSKDPDKPIFLLTLNPNGNENEYPSYSHNTQEIEMDEPFDEDDKFWAGKMDSSGVNGGSGQVIEKIVEIPVERIVEKIVQVPVDRIVEIPVERIVEVPVERIIEVPVERIVEKIVEVPVLNPSMPPQPMYTPQPQAPPQPMYSPQPQAPPQPMYSPQPQAPTISPTDFFGGSPSTPVPNPTPVLDPEGQKFLAMFNRFKAELGKAEQQFQRGEIDQNAYDKKKAFMLPKMQELVPKLEEKGIPYSWT